MLAKKIRIPSKPVLSGAISKIHNAPKPVVNVSYLKSKYKRFQMGKNISQSKSKSPSILHQEMADLLKCRRRKWHKRH
jgi:hypothetical protein